MPGVRSGVHQLTQWRSPGGRFTYMYLDPRPQTAITTQSPSPSLISSILRSHLGIHIFTTSDQTFIPNSQRISADLINCHYMKSPKLIAGSHVHQGSQVQPASKPHMKWEWMDGGPLRNTGHCLKKKKRKVDKWILCWEEALKSMAKKLKWAGSYGRVRTRTFTSALSPQHLTASVESITRLEVPKSPLIWSFPIFPGMQKMKENWQLPGLARQ